MKKVKKRCSGMATIEVVLIIALAAIVAVAVGGFYKFVYEWSSVQIQVITGDQATIDEGQL